MKSTTVYSLETRDPVRLVDLQTIWAQVRAYVNPAEHPEGYTAVARISANRFSEADVQAAFEMLAAGIAARSTSNREFQTIIRGVARTVTPDRLRELDRCADLAARLADWETGFRALRLELDSEVHDHSEAVAPIAKPLVEALEPFAELVLRQELGSDTLPGSSIVFAWKERKFTVDDFRRAAEAVRRAKGE